MSRLKLTFIFATGRETFPFKCEILIQFRLHLLRDISFEKRPFLFCLVNLVRQHNLFRLFIAQLTYFSLYKLFFDLLTRVFDNKSCVFRHFPLEFLHLLLLLQLLQLLLLLVDFFFFVLSYLELLEVVLFLLDQVLVLLVQLLGRLGKKVVIFLCIGLPLQLCVTHEFVLLDRLGFLGFVGRKVQLLVFKLQLLLESLACVDRVYFLQGSPDFSSFIWRDLITFLLLLLRQFDRRTRRDISTQLVLYLLLLLLLLVYLLNRLC